MTERIHNRFTFDLDSLECDVVGGSVGSDGRVGGGGGAIVGGGGRRVGSGGSGGGGGQRGGGVTS